MGQELYHKCRDSLHRRRYERVEMHSPATVIFSDYAEKPVMVKDLSLRGAGIETTFPLEASQNITIRIRGPKLDKGAAYRKARVTWAREEEDGWWQAGLDFGIDNLLQFSS